MKKYRESVILYLKVFLVLFIIGFLIPNIVVLALNQIIIKPDIQPPDNYLYVIGHLENSKSFYEVFFEIMGKVIEF